MKFYFIKLERYMNLPIEAEIGQEYEIEFGGIKYGTAICVGAADESLVGSS